MDRLKKGLIAFHRYLGLACCVMFLMWFLSGIVMMYVEIPHFLRRDEAYDFNPPLECPAGAIMAQEAARLAKITGPPKELLIHMHEGRPVWRVMPEGGPYISVFADNGKILEPIASEDALRIAGHFKAWGGPLRLDREIDVDPWILGGQYAPHPPFYRIVVDDPAKHIVYVSKQTGMVVQFTTWKERFWAFCGPIIHWVRPLVLSGRWELQFNVLMWVIGAGIAMCLLGIVIGIWQFRFKRTAEQIREGATPSPYKEAWLRWHHYFGLVFGLFAFTWIFSGLLSMRPFDWLPRADAKTEEADVMSAGPLNLEAVRVEPDQAVAALRDKLVIREMRLIQFDGKPYYLAYETPKITYLCDAQTGLAISRLDEPALRSAAEKLVPGARLVDWIELGEYDAYYNSKKTFRHSIKRLPVIRAEFDDPKKMQYYISPFDGSIAMRLEPLSRMERWLFGGLHSFNIPGLWNNRPLWDIVVAGLCLGGIALTVSSVKIAWDWFVRKSG